LVISVADWLKELGLEQYAPAFRNNDIDGAVLPELTADDLAGLGVSSIGHRRKLLAAIAALRPDAARFATVRTAIDVGSPASSSAAPERRQLSVLFCDLVGSTSLAVRLVPQAIAHG
jgi:class 3 adenylate cyclase